MQRTWKLYWTTLYLLCYSEFSKPYTQWYSGGGKVSTAIFLGYRTSSGLKSVLFQLVVFKRNKEKYMAAIT